MKLLVCNKLSSRFYVYKNTLELVLKC